MKQITMAVFFTTALTVFLTSSCKKEQLDPAGTGIITGASAGTLDLVADSWKRESSGLYIQVFRNIIPQVYRSSGVNIFLLDGSKEILINNSVSFMGGHLLGRQSLTDILIVFQPLLLGEKPFDQLNIKVVFF